jgi:hypothetical protein
MEACRNEAKHKADRENDQQLCLQIAFQVIPEQHPPRVRV